MAKRKSTSPTDVEQPQEVEEPLNVDLDKLGGGEPQEAVATGEGEPASEPTPKSKGKKGDSPEVRKRHTARPQSRKGKAKGNGAKPGKLDSRPHRNLDNEFAVVNLERARGRYGLLLQQLDKKSFTGHDISRKLESLNHKKVVTLSKLFPSGKERYDKSARHFLRELMRDKAIKVKGG